MRGVKAISGAAVSALLLAVMGPLPALADTIEAALVRAYQNNPQLNAQRATVRATDESVPQALSGYRPKVAVTCPLNRFCVRVAPMLRGASKPAIRLFTRLFASPPAVLTSSVY